MAFGSFSTYLVFVCELIKAKVCIWSLSYTPYFNLVPIILIVSIWSLKFQYRVNLVLTINFWMKTDDTSNGQNKKLAFIDVTIQ